jgi:hypothetical protein
MCQPLPREVAAGAKAHAATERAADGPQGGDAIRRRVETEAVAASPERKAHAARIADHRSDLVLELMTPALRHLHLLLSMQQLLSPICERRRADDTELERELVEADAPAAGGGPLAL